jgi:hypothetical protein
MGANYPTSIPASNSDVQIHHPTNAFLRAALMIPWYSFLDVSVDKADAWIAD